MISDLATVLSHAALLLAALAVWAVVIAGLLEFFVHAPRQRRIAERLAAEPLYRRDWPITSTRGRTR